MSNMVCSIVWSLTAFVIVFTDCLSSLHYEQIDFISTTKWLLAYSGCWCMCFHHIFCMLSLNLFVNFMVPFSWILGVYLVVRSVSLLTWRLR